MTKRDHTVLILGAGFSADAGIPTVRPFLQNVRQRFESPESTVPPFVEHHYRDVLSSRHLAAASRDMMSFDLDNIETLFSLIDMRSILSFSEDPTQPSALDGVNHVIAHTVEATNKHSSSPHVSLGINRDRFARLRGQSVLKRFETRASRAGMKGAYADRVELFMSQYEFVSSLMAGLMDPPESGRTTAIVTFNYDTVVEESLAAVGVRAAYSLPGASYAGGLWANGTPATVPVLKLHGSANWAYAATGGNDVIVFDRYEDYGASMTPMLVPPTWHKEVASHAMRSVWGAAFRELVKATRIVVIGYSAPETDPHFHHLMAASLAENPGLYSLDVVDVLRPGEEIDASPVRRRYTRLFEPLDGYGRLRFRFDGLAGFIGLESLHAVGLGLEVSHVGHGFRAGSVAV